MFPEKLQRNEKKTSPFSSQINCFPRRCAASKAAFPVWVARRLLRRPCSLVPPSHSRPCVCASRASPLASLATAAGTSVRRGSRVPRSCIFRWPALRCATLRLLVAVVKSHVCPPLISTKHAPLLLDDSPLSHPQIVLSSQPLFLLLVCVDSQSVLRRSTKREFFTRLVLFPQLQRFPLAGYMHNLHIFNYISTTTTKITAAAAPHGSAENPPRAQREPLP